MIFYTNNSRRLALSVAKKSGLRIGKFSISQFKDGEIFVQLKEDVKGKEVYILGSGNPRTERVEQSSHDGNPRTERVEQSSHDGNPRTERVEQSSHDGNPRTERVEQSSHDDNPPSDNMLELLILINTLKENGASKVNLIMPYFAYAKSDHIDPEGSSLNAKLMASLIKTAGADSVMAINIHSKTAESFFEIPLIHLSAMSLLAEEFKKLKIKDLKVVSPDAGGIERALEFSNSIVAGDIVTIKKTRPAPDKVKVLEVSGDVKNKNVVIVDDMIQSGGTVLKAVEILKKQGAKDIYIAVAHFLFSGPALPLLLKNKNIKKIFITNTIRSSKKLPEKFKVSRVDDIISNAVLDFNGH